MAVTITWDDVVNIAPELVDVAEATQDAILDDVALQLNDDIWGARINIGAKYLAAHLASITNRGGAVGQVTEEKVGEVSRSYAVDSASGGGSGLDDTSYGQEFQRLLRTNVKARFLVA